MQSLDAPYCLKNISSTIDEDTELILYMFNWDGRVLSPS